MTPSRKRVPCQRSSRLRRRIRNASSNRRGRLERPTSGQVASNKKPDAKAPRSAKKRRTRAIARRRNPLGHELSPAERVAAEAAALVEDLGLHLASRATRRRLSPATRRALVEEAVEGKRRQLLKTLKTAERRLGVLDELLDTVSQLLAELESPT